MTSDLELGSDDETTDVVPDGKVRIYLVKDIKVWHCPSPADCGVKAEGILELHFKTISNIIPASYSGKFFIRMCKLCMLRTHKPTASLLL